MFIFNSLWPSNVIWRQGSTGRSTWAQVMAAWWHQAITWTHVDLSSVKSYGIHRRALLWEDLQIPISKTRLKIPFLESYSDLPGTNEYENCCWYFKLIATSPRGQRVSSACVIKAGTLGSVFIDIETHSSGVDSLWPCDMIWRHICGSTWLR